MGFRGDRGGRRPGRSLLRGIWAALALAVPVIGAPITLELEVNQWLRRDSHAVVPGASLVGLRGAAGFADGLLTLGDVDGDGRPEILDGQVLVFTGRKGGWETRPSAVLSGGQPGDLFGSTLAVGKFAGRQGGLELAIGAPGWHGTHEAEGAVHLVRGEAVRTAGVGEVASGVHVGSQTRAEVGRLVANGGDLDGDGWEELVMGLPRMGHSPNKAGRLEVLWGGYGSDREAGGAAWTNILSYPKDPFVVAVERRVAEVAASRAPVPVTDAGVGGSLAIEASQPRGVTIRVRVPTG